VNTFEGQDNGLVLVQVQAYILVDTIGILVLECISLVANEFSKCEYGHSFTYSLLLPALHIASAIKQMGAIRLKMRSKSENRCGTLKPTRTQKSSTSQNNASDTEIKR